MLNKYKHYRKCVMGCCPGGKEKVHSFPTDPKRFAEWVRILGKKPKVKKPFLCNRHFKRECFFGKKLSKYALPNAEPNRSSNASTEVSEAVPSPNNSNIHDISNAEPNESSNASTEVLESVPPSNNSNIHDISNSSELQESIDLEETCLEKNDISTNTNATDEQNVINLVDDFEEESHEKEVLVSECLENSDSNDSNKQISALKNALDRCLKQLAEEKSQKKKLKQENVKLSQELEAYKKLTANLGSESSGLKEHILREVVQFLTENEEKEKVDKKSIYMIRTAGKYCDVNLINM